MNNTKRWFAAATMSGGLFLSAGYPNSVWGVNCPPLPEGPNACAGADVALSVTVLEGPSSCVVGETIALKLGLGLTLSAADRFDVGVFVGDNGADPLGGAPASCTFDSLTPLGPPFDLSGGSGPYRDLDGDACGDLSREDGQTNRNLELTSVLCRDNDGDGFLDLDWLVTWNAGAGSGPGPGPGTNPVCADPNDPTNFYPDVSRCLLQRDTSVTIAVEPDTPPPPASPILQVTKAALPASLAEPGGDVRFEVLVQNTSPSMTLTLQRLIDDPFGDLNGKGDCALPQELPPGVLYGCAFPASVNGNAGDNLTDTVVASAVDGAGRVHSAQASAQVAITDIPSSLSVVKTADPPTLPVTGGSVSFTVTVVNTSAADAVTLLSLVDAPSAGDLNGQGCSLPQTLAPGQEYSCGFVETLAGAAEGDTRTNTVTAEATDDDGNTLRDSDSATVTYSDGPVFALEVTKLASPTALAEPGGTVKFLVLVANQSSEDAQLIRLVDEVSGVTRDLGGEGTCALGGVIGSGGEYRCEFQTEVVGRGGDGQTDTVTAEVQAGANRVSDSDSARVRILDLASAMEVVTIATPPSVRAPGGSVTFTIGVGNASAVDTLTLQRIEDSVHGDINGQGTCQLPQILAAAATYTCSFVRDVAGRGGEVYTSTLTLTADSSDGATLVENATLRVPITASSSLGPSAIPVFSPLGLLLVISAMAFLADRFLRRRG